MKRLTALFACLALLALTAYPVQSEPVRVRQFTMVVATDNVATPAFRVSKYTRSISMQIPTIDAATVQVQTSMDNTTYVPYHVAIDNGTALTTVLWATASGTGGITVAWPPGLVNYRWFKIVTSADQTADRTFTIYERED